MGFALLIEEDVPWFDVTMQNAVFMRVMHSAREFRDQFHRVADRHRLTLDHFVKLTAFHEFHAEVASATALAHLIDGNDARMVETGGDFGFPTKTFQVGLARPLTKADDF